MLGRSVDKIGKYQELKEEIRCSPRSTKPGDVQWNKMICEELMSFFVSEELSSGMNDVGKLMRSDQRFQSSEEKPCIL